jgi:hypothetical protein
MPDRADHEQESECVTDEARDTNEDTAGEDDQSVEQLTSGDLAASEPFLSVEENPEADALYDKRPQRADADQDCKGPPEADLAGDRDESRNLRTDEDQTTKEEHNSQGNAASSSLGRGESVSAPPHSPFVGIGYRTR